MTTTTQNKPETTLPAPLVRTNSAGGRSAASFPLDAVIERIPTHNPKRAGSDTFKRFELVRTGMTVGEYYVACAKLEGVKEGTSYARDVVWSAEPKRNEMRVWPAGTTAAQMKAALAASK